MSFINGQLSINYRNFAAVMTNCKEIIDKAGTMTAQEFIVALTDCYLECIGGQLTQENMGRLTTDQHTLLAYRWMMEEVMEGGFIQMIQNGYAGYVLEGPFAQVLKKEWGMKELAKLIYDVRHEYHVSRERFERDMTDEEFMALYEELEKLNEMGDDFLDEFQEKTTPAVREFVVQNKAKFILNH